MTSTFIYPLLLIEILLKTIFIIIPDEFDYSMVESIEKRIFFKNCIAIGREMG